MVLYKVGIDMKSNKCKKVYLTENGNYKKYSFDFGVKHIGDLRCEIVLDSVYFSDYSNSFGITLESCEMFFRSYLDYICELCDECNKLLSDNGCNKRVEGDDFDNKDNLINGLYMYCDDINDILIGDKESDENEK